MAPMMAISMSWSSAAGRSARRRRARARTRGLRTSCSSKRAAPVAAGDRFAAARAVVRQPAHPRASRRMGRAVARDADRAHPRLAARPIRAHRAHRGRSGVPALGYVVDYAGLVGALDAAVATSGLRVERGAQVTSIAHEPGLGADRIRDRRRHRGVPSHRSSPSPTERRERGASRREKRRLRSKRRDRARRNRSRARAYRVRAIHPEGPIALLPYEVSYALVWTMPAERRPRAVRRNAGCFSRAPAGAFRRARRALHRSQRARGAPGGAAVAEGHHLGRGAHRQRGAGAASGCRPGFQPGPARRLGARGRNPQARARRRSAAAAAYRARRRIDRTGGIAFTHGLVNLFSNDWLPLGLARGAGLTLLDCLPPAKDFVVRRMMFGARG